jgi:CubicO group peptidase (beta-lactamase class C family)
MQRGVRGGVFPAAVLLVADDGEPLLHAGYGDAERLDAVFDVASLTKAVATSVAMMWLVDRGRVDLDAPAARYLGELRRPGADRIRIRHLLAHASGLPAWRPYFRRLRGAEVVRAAAREPLESPPGRRAVYSDLGFMLIGAIVERAAGRPLDQLLADEIFGPLGLRRTFFVRGGTRPPCGPVLPTGRCAWRRRVLRGEVHDQNAAAMGGVAGHAGLFSTAHDLHRICRALVGCWSGDRGGTLSREVVRLFWRRSRVPGSTWCLGWDTPSPGASSAGRYLRRAVGHLGFTGCSLWVDPRRARWVILLTNRVATGRDPARMQAFRPRLHDRVLEALP